MKVQSRCALLDVRLHKCLLIFFSIVSALSQMLTHLLLEATWMQVVRSSTGKRVQHS